MYNFDQLKMFLEVVESGSFSACARKLGKVQSAISQGIANLEIDLNVQLFDRSTRKPGLTEDGARLLPYVRAILKQSCELESVVESIERKEEPLIRLAVDSALFNPRLIKILERFGNIFPNTSIEIKSVIGADVSKKISANEADLGLMFCDMSLEQEVDFGYIGNMSFYAVCGVQHPLAKSGALGVADLLPHRQLLVRGNDGDTIPYFNKLSTEVWWANSYPAILQLVEQGVGWSHLPCYLADEAIQQKKSVGFPCFLITKPGHPSI